MTSLATPTPTIGAHAITLPCGTALQLLPQRALWWPAARMVLVADVHFGKAATFRRAGQPVPHGTTADNLARLDALLAATGADHLVFLGDFLHARSGAADGWPTWLEVRSSQPVLACLASQYAGWSLSASKEETGGKKFFSLGSGPARALAAKEPLFAELGYRDRAECDAL